MKVVIVSPKLPLPFRDTAARWLYVLVRELDRRGHEVACLVSSGEDFELVEQCRGLVGSSRVDLRFFPLRGDANVLRRKWRSMNRPYSELLYNKPLADALADELAGGYDVLHLEHLWTGWLGLGVPRALLNVHHFEIVDWEDRTDLTLSDRKQLLQMRRATCAILRGTRYVRAFTDRLEEKTLDLAPDVRSWVVPFALDPALYPLQPLVVEPVVGMIGSMFWHPTRSAAERLLERIWPAIKCRHPQAKLLICGWDARKYLERYLPRADVRVEENLPHPEEFFRRAAVLLYAPPKGSGMKIKVLESMAYGVPVLTNAEGAEGLACTNGEDCFVHEDDESLAACAVELLRDHDLRSRARANARSLVERCYSPVPVVARLLEVYDAIRD